MTDAFQFTLFAWLGWIVVTAALVPAYFVLGALGALVFSRLLRVYHLTVIAYWLARLEKEGTHIFEKARKKEQP